MAGDLTLRFDAALERVLRGGPPAYTTEFLLADVVPRPTRRFTNFSGDLSGRYVGALAVNGHGGVALDRLVADIVRLQKPDGHFGAEMSASTVTGEDMARLWGNGRLLVGLLETYRANPRPETLAAARRLGDFLLRIAPLYNDPTVQQEFSFDQFAAGYICWTQNIEGLVELHRVTRERRYLRLAEEIANRVEYLPAQHSHGFLTSVRGILELYRAGAGDEYLRRAEAEWKAVADSPNLLIQGAVPEAFAPRIRRDEGCSEADWLRLSLALWQLTNKPEYLEAAERTLFNEFSFNQSHSGDFGHHEITETGFGYSHARAWWCCTLHGLRAFRDIFDAVFHARGGALDYDLPVDGRGRLDGLEVQAESTLGADGRIVLSIVKSDGASRVVALRRPPWAKAVALELNGKPAEAPEAGGYLRIERAWTAGDRLALRYDLQTRTVRRNGRIALFHGPWLLGVDAAESPNFFDEPAAENRVILPPEPQRTQVKAVPWSVPIAHFLLKYAPGGYPDQRQTAVLRPIAENTSLAGSTVWEFWLR